MADPRLPTPSDRSPDGPAAPARPALPAARVDPGDSTHLQPWLDHFGVTAEQLGEAVRAVGGDPQAVAEHLLNQGGSAGPG